MKRKDKIIQKFQFWFKSKQIINPKDNMICLSGKSELVYPNNKISTSKYTWFTFIPKNMIEQFTKMANIYFLLIAGLQAIPVISISNGVPSILLPLSFIIILSAAKDFYEDYKREKSDQIENNKTCLKLQKYSGAFETIKWKEIHVGDIIKVQKNQYFPCDVLLLGTDKPKGVCYIETKSLDGETNLKQKQTPHQLQSFFKDKTNCISKLLTKAITIEYEPSNQYLYSFKGTCYLSDEVYDKIKQEQNNQDMMPQITSQLLRQQSINCETIPISNNNFVLRGCKLQNTNYIYGLVLYTGHDTKIMRNAQQAHVKQSRLEKEMGKQIIEILLLQLSVCLFASFYYSIWYEINRNVIPYLELSESEFMIILIVRFGNWILMFGNLVPISLMVTVEMVRFVQAFFISYDRNYMTSYQYGVETPCIVQSSNLNEELGQVEYIFSDKTGTLTCNIMEFRYLCVNGISYSTEQVQNVLKNVSNPQYEFMIQVLLLLSLCHEVVVEEVDEKQFSYNASSPDELALINFTKQVGFEYKGLNEDNIAEIQIGFNVFKFQILHTLQFDSFRKRNSIILKDLQTNNFMIFIKGADSIILERTDKIYAQNSIELYQKMLLDYANVGLRTLLLASRKLTQKEYNNWNQRYHNACIQLQDSEKIKQQLQDEIEQNLIIIGATAIEDKLQDKVPETIMAFKQANIKIWVLTGDKVETAINIGYSCGLLNYNMNIVEILEKDNQLIENQLKLINSERYAIVINGDVLGNIFQDENKYLQKALVDAAEKVSSILCCRVSPLQKQQVVCLLREQRPDASTLAIGDGANDVSMISAAHIGVGIKGLEGQQASRASDYAIGEFQILRPLLFIHGRECYRRNANLVLYNFFKNILLVFPQFWLSLYDAFSGQSPYDQLTYQFYNVFYVSAPIVIFAVLDQQYSTKVLFLNKNNQYGAGQKRDFYSGKQFWIWFINAVYQSVIISFFTVYLFDTVAVKYSGRTYSIYWTGARVFGLVVVVANIKVGLLVYSWNLLLIIFLIGGIGLYFASDSILSHIEINNLWSVNSILFGTPNFYFTLLLVISATSLLDYFFMKWIEYSKNQKGEEFKGIDLKFLPDNEEQNLQSQLKLTQELSNVSTQIPEN